MNILTVLLIVLFVALILSLPSVGLHSGGYVPTGGVGVLLLVVLLVLLLR